MKLNHDCIRDCLLYFEENLTLASGVYPSDVIKNLKNKYSENSIQYSILQLTEVGFIDSGFSQEKTFNGAIYSEQLTTQITWDGHAYLDTIRDPKVWKKAKHAASNFKSVPLSMMATIGSQIIMGIVNKSIGL